MLPQTQLTFQVRFHVKPITSKWFSYFDIFLFLYQCSSPSTWWCDCHGYLGLIHHCHMDPSSGACQWCPCHCIHSDCSPQQWLHCAEHIFYHQHSAQRVAGGHRVHHPGGGTQCRWELLSRDCKCTDLYKLAVYQILVVSS